MKRFLIVMGVFFTIAGAAQDTAKTVSTLEAATIYFGYGAELTHQSSVHVDPATRFIVISGLSTSVDIGTLQISVPEHVSLLSQRYKVTEPTPVAVPQSAAARLKEDSIASVMKEMRKVDVLIAIEQETMTKTGELIEAALKSNSGPKPGSEDLLRLVNFYNNKISSAKTSIYNYVVSNEQSALRVQAIRQRLKALEVDTPELKPKGELTLQVICRQSAEIPISISYYTNNAGWTPLYDVRVNSKTNKVKLVYKASITQTSGFDWKKTKLTLSTGTPNFGVSAPVLTPWYLQLYVPGLYTDLQRRANVANLRMNNLQSLQDKKTELNEVVVSGKAAGVVVGYGTIEQTIEPSTIQQFTTLNEGQLNTSFEIDLPYDIESDGDLHQVTIRDEEISSILKNYAVPRLDRDAYLLAEVADWQTLDLLPGEANIIMDETYVGKSMIDPATTADTLNLSLGRDRRIAIKRTLVKESSSIKTSGNSSRQAFTYELTVKNNKLTDVNLLLKDQFPLSSIKEVEVKLDDSGEAIVNEETGALTWKVDLKPGESRKFRFSYTIKYPKDKKIINIK